MNLLIALLLGAASAFAFQPVALWPLMVLAFAALCELTARTPRLRSALAIGWGFGVGQFSIGLNWIATAFTYQAAMPAWLGWVAVVLLSCYLALYPMLAVGVAWRIGRDHRPAQVLALAGAWGIAEFLRGTMFTGFAWNPVGVALVDTWWRLSGRWIGTYGLSALVVLAGGLLWLAVRGERRAAIGLAAALMLALIPAGLPTPLDHGRQPHVRIVQPNIGQQDKWNPAFERIASARLTHLSSRPGSRDLIFWPEAAVTDPLADGRASAEPYVAAQRRATTAALTPGELLLTGGLTLDSRDHQSVTGAANSVFALVPGGGVAAVYDKAHLVPYGEYLPMRPLLSALGLSRLAPGDLDFRAGPGPRTASLPGGLKAGFQVCYEIIFSGQVVDRALRPDFIFNPSNDAWFGRWGPPQHLAQARLRAAEEGLPVVRSTPTGVSALVDADGGLVAAIPWHQAGRIDAPLPHRRAATPFARFGNPLPLGLALGLLIAAIALGRRRRYSAT